MLLEQFKEMIKEAYVLDKAGRDKHPVTNVFELQFKKPENIKNLKVYPYSMLFRVKENYTEVNFILRDTVENNETAVYLCALEDLIYLCAEIDSLPYRGWEMQITIPDKVVSFNNVFNDSINITVKHYFNIKDISIIYKKTEILTHPMEMPC